MKRSQSIQVYLRLLAIVILSIAWETVQAQKFSVKSFRVLPNDVSAFIEPVRDLNDEDCALIKVQGSPDFVFSTPLGIVKRTDNVGEIWIYVPRGSKKITLKHPRWGVLRDYTFPSRLESHMSYELRIEEPEESRVLAVTTPTTTLHDTLVVTRTDTLIVAPPKRKEPFHLFTLLSGTFGSTSKTVLGGVRIIAMGSHGGYAHFSTDFGKSTKTSISCNRTGVVNGSLPYYSGDKQHSAIIATIGAAHRLSSKVRIFEGVGYGYNNTFWQLAQSEGGGYVKNSYYSHEGFTFEAGALLTFGRVAVSGSIISIKGKQWYGSLGIGIKI